MIKKDKIILVFYIVLGFSFVAGLLYVDSTFEKNNLTDILPEQITSVVIERDIDVGQQDLFLAFQDVKRYPLILPYNVLDLEVTKMDGNTVFTKSLVMERGIKSSLNLKHQFEPYSTYEIEVLDGDAKGTNIKLIFEGNSTQTHLTTELDFKVTGVLNSFLFIPKSNIHHALNTVTDAFVLSIKDFRNEYQKTVDEIYRTTLYRAADPAALSYYVPLLRENKITVDEIIQEILESDEYARTLKPSEFKSIEELSSNSFDTVNSLYQKVLFRQADGKGLQHFGSLMDAGKLSADGLEEILLNSKERKSYEKGILSYLLTSIFVSEQQEIKHTSQAHGEIPFYELFDKMDPTLMKGTSNLKLETIDHVKMAFPEMFNQKDGNEEILAEHIVTKSGAIEEREGHWIDCDISVIACKDKLRNALLQYFGLLLDEQIIAEQELRHDGDAVLISCSVQDSEHNWREKLRTGDVECGEAVKKFIYKNGQYLLPKYVD